MGKASVEWGVLPREVDALLAVEHDRSFMTKQRRRSPGGNDCAIVQLEALHRCSVIDPSHRGRVGGHVLAYGWPRAS